MSGTVLVDANVLLDILTADEHWLVCPHRSFVTRKQAAQSQ
jgi:hypothetical protein